jgi:hypothetical protein
MQQPLPASAGARRLAGEVAVCAGDYRRAAAVDLTLVSALLRHDEAEAAVHAVDEQRAAVRMLARRLHNAVAVALVEQEAERIVEAAAAESPPAS